MHHTYTPVLQYDILDILILIAAGAAGGFMSGLLGVGGGIIFIPILDFVFTRFGFPREDLAQFIIANSLFIIIFTGVINSYKQYRIKNFYPRFILYTSVPAIATAWFFTWLIQNGTWYSKETFNLVFLLMLSPMILRMLYTRKRETPKEATEPKPYQFGLTGLLTGVFTAFSGLGGGMIMVPSFTDFLKMDIKKATSISAGVVPLIALMLSIKYFTSTPSADVVLPHIGYIVYSVALPMAAGTFITVGFGVSLSHKTPSPVIKTIFAVFALLVIIKLVIENYF